MDVEQGNPLSVLRSLERLDSQMQEEPSSSALLPHPISTSTQAKAFQTSTLVRHLRGRTFLRVLSVGLLIVMIITSSLQLLELLTGTRQPTQVLLLQRQQPGKLTPSQGLSDPGHFSVTRLLEAPYELQMLMHFDTQASVPESTQHPT